MYENSTVDSSSQTTKERLFVRIIRDTLPRAVDRYPFLYLERGRLEIDDSSIKWIDAEGACIRLPVATIHCLLLGPGTTITHEAVKVASAANCHICWVGEDSLLFYAAGITPTSNTRNLQRQALLSADPHLSLAVARALFLHRFPKEDVAKKTLQELMGMEGHRVRKLYTEKAEAYGVGWKGRVYTPGKFELSDLTNRIITSTNAALYSLLSSIVHSLGYSPHLGFIHSGSPLPFIYDLADLYKEHCCIDLAFSLTRAMAGQYNKYTVAEAFRKRVMEQDIIGCAVTDIEKLLGEKSARRYCK